MNKNGNTLGENIRRLREKNNMTQKQLSERLDCSDKTVSKWENGDTSPSMNTINQIAKLFAIPVGDLMGGYVAENLSQDQNMEQIMNFMNDINKKMNYLLQKNDVTEKYLEATKKNEERISYVHDIMEGPVEPEEYDPADRYEEEIYMMEIAERVDAYQFDDALSYCDELIEKGNGAMAYNAMGICDKYIDLMLCAAFDEEDIDAEWNEQRKYAKIYIHHLMHKYRLSVNDFLE